MSDQPLRFPPHTIQNMRDREIAPEQVRLTLAEPESVTGGRGDRKIYAKRYFDESLKQEMLLRVVVEESVTEQVVVTVYKTSQIRRYLKG